MGGLRLGSEAGLEDVPVGFGRVLQVPAVAVRGVSREGSEVGCAGVEDGEVLRVSLGSVTGVGCGGVIGGGCSGLDDECTEEVRYAEASDSIAEGNSTHGGPLQRSAASGHRYGLQGRQGGEVGALTEPIGSQHVEEQSVLGGPETDVVRLGMVRMQLPPEMLEGHHQAARGLCDPADVHERVSIAGGATGIEPVVVGVEHDHERADEGPSLRLRIGETRTAAHKRPSVPWPGSWMVRSAGISVAVPPGVELVVPQPPTGADGTGLAGLDQVESDHGCSGHTGLVLGELAGLDDADDQIGDTDRDLRIGCEVTDESFSRSRWQVHLQRAAIAGEVGPDPFGCTAAGEHTARYGREVVEQRGVHVVEGEVSSSAEPTCQQLRVIGS